MLRVLEQSLGVMGRSWGVLERPWGFLGGVARGPEREKDQCGNEKRIKRFSVIFTAHCSSNTCVEWWIVFSLVFLYGAADTADAVDMHA